MLINEITVFENHSKCLALKFLHFQLSLVYPNQLSAQACRYVTHMFESASAPVRHPLSVARYARNVAKRVFGLTRALFS